MNEHQEIRSEALEQATRVAVQNSKDRTGMKVNVAALLKLADRFSHYIASGDHG